jgi:hypothetical protein
MPGTPLDRKGWHPSLIFPASPCHPQKRERPAGRIRELEDHCEALENALERIRVVAFEPKQERRLWNELHCECRAVDEAGRARIHAQCRDLEVIVFLASPWNTKNSCRCEVEGVGGIQCVLS